MTTGMTSVMLLLALFLGMTAGFAPIHSRKASFLVHSTLAPKDVLSDSGGGPEWSEEVQSAAAAVSDSDSRLEFAALSTGCVVDIQVGDIDLARKAWKKRRRSGSPLLIPCSILSTDRKAAVLSSLVYLLQKFGRPISECNMPERPSGFKSRDIAIALPLLNRRYETHLRASLSHHAEKLGFDNDYDLVCNLFTPQVEEELGVTLWTVGDYAWLATRMTQMSGHRVAAQCAILQTSDVLENDDLLRHTGITRVKTEEKSENGPPVYDLILLSAALRANQQSLDTGAVTNGSKHRAVLLGVDPMGDGGVPLAKVSLNLPKVVKRKQSKSIEPTGNAGDKPIEHELSGLKVGDGPFRGQVIRVSEQNGAAFVDIGVGRRGKGRGEKPFRTKILGMLPFDDAAKQQKSSLELLTEIHNRERKVDEFADALNSIQYSDDDEESDFIQDDFENVLADMDVTDLFADEADNSSDEPDDIMALVGNRIPLGEDETEEDVSHMVSIEDGVYSFNDPESGESVVMGSLNDETGSCTSEASISSLQVGDEVDVYIQSVSKQSGAFIVSTQAAVQPMKERKKEAGATKKLDRLLGKFGGKLGNVLKLKGQQGEGKVVALSSTGDWCYVQPQFQDLPVGIATIAEDFPMERLSKGDAVNIRLDGVDTSRGQLALTVLSKL